MLPLTQFCRRRKVSFWGRDYFVTPRLLNFIHGDGLQVIAIQPLATRPDRYLVRVDSKVSLDNSDHDALVDGVLQEIYGAIENEWGSSEEDWEHDNGRTYHRHNPWPALNDSCGCSWWLVDRLKTPDRRREHRVRADIKRAA
jgi:hypothetical protein